MQFRVELTTEVVAFLDSLDMKMQAKIHRHLQLLREFGYQLKEPHSKKLAGYDLYELRIKSGSNIVRLFYFHLESGIYVVTSGYIKKDNKTKRKEIEKALKIKQKFRRQK